MNLKEILNDINTAKHQQTLHQKQQKTSQKETAIKIPNEKTETD